MWTAIGFGVILSTLLLVYIAIRVDNTGESGIKTIKKKQDPRDW